MSRKDLLIVGGPLHGCLMDIKGPWFWAYEELTEGFANRATDEVYSPTHQGWIDVCDLHGWNTRYSNSSLKFRRRVARYVGVDVKWVVDDKYLKGYWSAFKDTEIYIWDRSPLLTAERVAELLYMLEATK